jgi:hypothetical protein
MSIYSSGPSDHISNFADSAQFLRSMSDIPVPVGQSPQDQSGLSQLRSTARPEEARGTDLIQRGISALFTKGQELTGSGISSLAVPDGMSGNALRFSNGGEVGDGDSGFGSDASNESSAGVGSSNDNYGIDYSEDYGAMDPATTKDDPGGKIGADDPSQSSYNSRVNEALNKAWAEGYSVDFDKFTARDQYGRLTSFDPDSPQAKIADLGGRVLGKAHPAIATVSLLGKIPGLLGYTPTSAEMFGQLEMASKRDAMQFGDDPDSVTADASGDSFAYNTTVSDPYPDTFLSAIDNPTSNISYKGITRNPYDALTQEEIWTFARSGGLENTPYYQQVMSPYTGSNMTTIMAASGGGLSELTYPARNAVFEGMVSGGGDGMSDSVPFSIEGQQPALLSRDEYVLPADVVSQLGDGSSGAGADMLDQFVDGVRSIKYGNTNQPRPGGNGLVSILSAAAGGSLMQPVGKV